MTNKYNGTRAVFTAVLSLARVLFQRFPTFRAIDHFQTSSWIPRENDVKTLWISDSDGSSVSANRSILANGFARARQRQFKLVCSLHSDFWWKKDRMPRFKVAVVRLRERRSRRLSHSRVCGRQGSCQHASEKLVWSFSKWKFCISCSGILDL